MEKVERGDIVTFRYENWKGEVAHRKVVVEVFYWGVTLHHTDTQMFLTGLDLDKLVYRDFAVKDISELVVVESMASWNKQ